MTAPFRHAEAVMGTVVSFDLRAPTEADRPDVADAPADAADAVAAAVAWLHWVDETFSTFDDRSEICRVRRGELAIDDTHPHVQTVLARCRQLSGRTGGYFDAYATGELDPSGLVKGWSVAVASDLLAAAGWGNHLVDGGGDIRLRGDPGSGSPWRVGINHPFRAGALCAVVELGSGAVATSGTYERGFHVIDPHRRAPAAALAAVTVIGPELGDADAYATAALAMGPAAVEWLSSLKGHEALVVDADGNGRCTPGFEAYRLDVGVASGG